MTNKKETGSYYTPKILSDFLVKHLFKNYYKDCKDIRILEPSCGDGEFLKSINKFSENKKISLDIVELNENELKKAKKNIKNTNILTNSFNEDFLDFKGSEYSLIIGNPPYINKKHLSKNQIKKCNDICRGLITDLGEVKNIWPTFLLKSIKILSDDGILSFVLPSELLQVNYTKKIREYLLNCFERVEIFAFNELVFPEIEQDVILFVGIKKANIESEKGVSFFQVKKLEDLKIPDYIEKYFNVHRKQLDKWTNYILDDDELNYIEDIINYLDLKKISHYCTKAEVGIVTAANDYYILNKQQIENFNLNRLTKPILQKGHQINNLFYFKKSDYDSLNNKNKNVNFIYFPNKKKEDLNIRLQKYIEIGESRKLHERYKMGKREHWYHVPSLWKSDAFFTKRSHMFPRMVINNANVLATDSLYRVNVKNEFNINVVGFSFYNSLTLILSEIYGRFYGGGVLELTPNEFKDIYIPYCRDVTDENFMKLDNLLRNNETIEKILSYTNSIILKEIGSDQIEKLEKIRIKLLNRRLKLN